MFKRSHQHGEASWS